jgi:probable rRNA maturation factor
LSLEKARSQGEEYGHGPEREIAYLTVHSVLHLLGYDHMDEGEQKRLMRSREEYICQKLGLER